MGETSLAAFIDRNSRFFTVLGVFGAISVYFTQLQVTSRWRRLGIVASLSIFLLIAAAIQRNIPPETSDKQPIDFVINIQRQRLGLTVFYVAFWAVVISVAAIVLRYSDTFMFLLQFLFFIGGIGVVRFFVAQAESPDGNDEQKSLQLGEDYEVVLSLAAFARIALFAIAFGGGVLLLMWLRGLIPVQSLLAFQGTSLLSVIILGILSGLLTGGLLWLIVVLMALFLHYALRWMRNIGALDDDWNFNEEYFSLENENR